jgi:uncharacterized membrane protein YphA (DoxX/SURF4 family)
MPGPPRSAYRGRVQRLLVNFPPGLPGLGLLLLRLSLAVCLAVEGAARAMGGLNGVGSNPRDTVFGVVLIGLSLPVGLGALTPFVHGGVVLVAMLSLGLGGNWEVSLLQIAGALAVAMVGPGAYSIDGRLFGPRKIVIPPPQSL